MQGFERRTLVVEGPLAYRVRRLMLARADAAGTEVMTLPMLAARLAGGFIEIASDDLVLPHIQTALSTLAFEELAAVAQLPGTPRAVRNALSLLWRSGVVTNSLGQMPRLRDLNKIEDYVRQSLPAGRLLLPDLVDAALSRVSLASQLLGVVVFDGVIEVDPVWRSLVAAIASATAVEWIAPAASERSWFSARTQTRPRAGDATPRLELCADPRAEVVEALRWVRELLASGSARAEDIAVATPSPSMWDDHFLVLAAEAKLPVHFSHGIPALGTREGQVCAALADILLRGVSQERVRRVLGRAMGTPFTANLGPDWAKGLSRSAGLLSSEQWREALSQATATEVNPRRSAEQLLKLIQLFETGAQAAEEAGNLLLSGTALSLWRKALQLAPPHAVDLSLQSLRVSDGREAGASIVWGPAHHLAAMPRRFTRLIGLSGRSWPRRDEDDPLLPKAVLKLDQLRELSLALRDRRDLAIIEDQSEQLVFSRSQRGATGSLQAPSALWRRGEIVRGRNRIPAHAYSETDRMFARPREAVTVPTVASSATCWRNWTTPDSQTANDGAIRKNHPVLLAAIDSPQTATTLQRLLLDPLGFVWEQGLGWRPIPIEVQPLDLEPRAFGELVHALISGTLRTLPQRGTSARIDIENALERARERVSAHWPLTRPVPPLLLWQHVLGEAANRARRALTHDNDDTRAARTWTECEFGHDLANPDSPPWSTAAPVAIGGSGLTLRGRMDRLDLVEDKQTVIVTDYKSGKPPARADSVIFGRGSELQRVFYALAAKRLFPEARRIISRLMYLGGTAECFPIPEESMDGALSTAEAYAMAGAEAIKSGRIAPGRKGEHHDELWLALPADQANYRRDKKRSFSDANKNLTTFWDKK